MQQWQIELLAGLNGLRGLTNLVNLGLTTEGKESDDSAKRWGILLGEAIYLASFLCFAILNIRKGYDESSLTCRNFVPKLFCGERRGKLATRTEAEKAADNKRELTSGIVLISGLLSVTAVILLSLNIKQGFWAAVASVTLSSLVTGGANTTDKTAGAAATAAAAGGAGERLLGPAGDGGGAAAPAVPGAR